MQDDQAATFRSAPGRRARFPARIRARVAYGSTTTDNVVTYTTDLKVDNADLNAAPA